MLQGLPDLPKKLDARKQSKEELFARRLQVIALYEEGEPVMKIAQRCGLSWSAVNAAIKLHKSGGTDALLPQSRGKKAGTGRVLSTEQETHICKLILMRRPWFYGLKDALWSLDTVLQLIDQQLDIQLSVRGLGNYLKRWGIVQPAGNKRPYDRCTKNIQMWLDSNYENLHKEAEENNTEIIWMNPVVKLNQIPWMTPESNDDNNKLLNVRAIRMSMISVTNNQGKLNWIIVRGVFNPEKQIKFVKNLIKERSKKIYLIRGDEKIFSSNDFFHLIKNENNIKVFPELTI